MGGCSRGRWCGLCGTLKGLCHVCQLCGDCCLCPPPLMPMEPFPVLPCMGPPPPPVRVIREEIMVPYPIYQIVPILSLPVKLSSGGGCCSKQFVSPSPCCSPYGCGERDPCGGPDYIGFSSCPRIKRRIYKTGQPIMPGYRGHIPGFRLHGAGRTFGNATRDTSCIMSKWGQDCPQLPCRIFEQ